MNAPLSRALEIAARVVVIAIVVATYVLLLLFAPVIRAQVDDDGALEALVDLTQRLTFSEALDRYPDAAMIVQVIEAHGETPSERLRWLSEHSRCVSRRLTPAQVARRHGNCRWAANLTADGIAPPVGWPHSRGFWEQRTRPRWLAHQPIVRALVEGRDTYRPCDETPITWGKPSERESVEAQGFLRAIECEGTRNVPYARATDGGPA